MHYYLKWLVAGCHMAQFPDISPSPFSPSSQSQPIQPATHGRLRPNSSDHPPHSPEPLRLSLFSLLPFLSLSWTLFQPTTLFLSCHELMASLQSTVVTTSWGARVGERESEDVDWWKAASQPLKCHQRQRWNVCGGATTKRHLRPSPPSSLGVNQFSLPSSS